MLLNLVRATSQYLLLSKYTHDHADVGRRSLPAAMEVIMDVDVRANWFSEDFVGSLLPLLNTTDVKSLILSCKAFNTAVKRQLRSLSPLYLSRSIPSAWDSLEHLQLSLSRTSKYCGSNACVCSFSSSAPLRSFDGVKFFRHAAHVDLSGQVLPLGALEVLSGHLTRLKSLTMDTCQLPMATLLDVTGLTTLRSLSISGLQLTGSLPAADQVADDKCWTSSRSLQEPGATPAPVVFAGDKQTARLLDAICHLQQLHELRMDRPAQLQAPLPSSTPKPLTYGVPLKHQAYKLSSLTKLTALSLLGNELSSSDWESLCGTIGPQLKEVHLHWGHVPDDSVYEGDFGLTSETFNNISKLTKLACLTMEVGEIPYYDWSPHSSYTLAPLAGTLTELRLRGSGRLPLLLSLTKCSKVVRLELSGLKAAAQNELLLQIVSSMPALQSLKVIKLHPPQQQVQPVADQLLPVLDNCCPQLTELEIPDLELNGTGLRLVSTATAGDGLSAASTAGGGGVRSCCHLQLCATHMMRSAFPHLSALTGLQSLVLYGMPQKQFPHLCKLNCLKSLPCLTNLTSLIILPILDELAHHQFKLQAHYAAAAEAAVAAGAGGDAEQPAAPPAAAAAAAGGAVLGDAGAAADGAEALMVDVDDDVEDEEFEGDEADNESDSEQQAEGGGPELPGDEAFDEDEPSEGGSDDEADLAELQDAQQAANQAVQALAQEMQQQADILANDPAQQVLAGGAFQQVVHMVLPGLGHLNGPGAADAAAAVVAVHAAAAQLAEGAAPAPEGGAGAVAALQNALHAAAAGQQQQQQQQAPVIPYAGMYGLRHHPFEPHLHILGSMTHLVNLELCCLQTTGLCFLHLSNLQSLQSLALGGSITLTDDSWHWMAQLQLPGVTCLSFTGCSTAVAAAEVAVGHSGASSSSSSNRSKDVKQLSDLCSETYKLVEALCRSFPVVVNLELGSCRFMTVDALVQLGAGLRKLERLRLLGVPKASLYTSKEPESASTAGGDAAVAGRFHRKLKSAGAGNDHKGTLQSTSDRMRKSGVERHYSATQAAMERLSMLALSDVGAIDLKCVEVCQSEMPRGLITASSGLQNVARFRAVSRSFIRCEGKLKAC